MPILNTLPERAKALQCALDFYRSNNSFTITKIKKSLFNTLLNRDYLLKSEFLAPPLMRINSCVI